VYHIEVDAMAASAHQSTSCPFDASRDDRKSARLAAERTRPEPGAQIVGSFAMAREILRNVAMKQGGAGADLIDTGDPEKVPVFYLDGEVHKRKRSELARFFTPKAIAGRYRAVMESTTDALLATLQAKGEGLLDQISFQLAVAVAAEIVGLTDSDPVGMAARIKATLASIGNHRRKGLARLIGLLAQRYRALAFFLRDVRPAIKARRKNRREDIISHLIDENYPDTAILIECMTYAAAGMVTTREFIVMAAWHLFDRDDLRQRFVTGSEDDQFTILQEILRLEPIAALLHRRASAATPVLSAGTLLAIDIRAANTDEAVTGPCPFALDPDRAARMKVNASYLNFGDGNHRCPGQQVALSETRVFLDRLLRLPGIRLVREPSMGWCEDLMSYELRDAIIACDRG
jgi:cytochrome P450